MAESKKSGYSYQPVTAKIKRTTQGGMKAEQPLLGSYAPVQMNSPAKGLGGLILKGAKGIVKSGMKAASKQGKAGQKLLGDGYTPFVEVSSKLGNGATRTLNAAKTGVGKSLFKRAVNLGKRTLKASAVIGTGALVASMFGGDSTPETKPQVTPNPTPKPKKKPYVKPGGKATGNMRDYKIGSSERYNEYEARGWKQDATTKGGEPRKKVEAVSTLKPEGVKTIKPKIETPKISIETKAPTSNPSAKDKFVAKKKAKAGVRKTGKAADKQKQADEAAAAGNAGKARRKQRAADRKTRKAKKKFSQAAAAIGVSSPAPKKKTKK